MKFLYLLKRLDTSAVTNDYDVMNGCVICAPHEEAAREIASKHAGDEGGYIWLADCFSMIFPIGLAAEEIPHGLVIRDFKAG